MSEPPSASVTHPVLGELRRGFSRLPDGEILLHGWYAVQVEIANRNVEVMVRSTEPGEVHALLPRLLHVIESWPTLRRIATDAVVHALSSDDGVTRDELDDAEEDLQLATIEIQPGGEVALHFDDLCGQHFLEGYWPAVHLDTEDKVIEATVEA